MICVCMCVYFIIDPVLFSHLSDYSRMSKDLERQLSSADFDKHAYLRQVAFNFDSAEDLEKHKKEIQLVADRTAQKLKQNVYQNYALFIDTSREISSLEAEMYQLSHLLNDHQVLTKAIQNLEVTEITEKKTGVKPTAVQEKHGIAQLLELVEGCSTVTEVPGRHLIFSSVLEELDPQTFEQVQEIRAFLLNDSLMLATSVKAKRKGPVKYHFQALYELDNLAVIGLKDTEKTKHLFEVRMFPDSHMFQAESEDVKVSWIKNLEEAKQAMSIERDNQKKFEQAVSNQMASRRRLTGDGFRSFERQPTEIATPEWVKDAPEQVDVFIAQREFDKAVNLIDKLKVHVKDTSDQLSYRDIKARTSHRINRLSEVLMNELKSSTSGSLRGGPRAARRAVGLLLRLGRASKACELFLQNHTHIVEHELKQIKLEGATTIFISNISSAFFTCLKNAAKEFELAFGENCGTYSAFMVWCIRELEAFLRFYCIESVFPPVRSNLNFPMVTESVSIILKEAQTLDSIGIDLGFKVSSILHERLSTAMVDARELLEEKLSTMGDTENWEPMDCRKSQAQVANVIMHLENMGVPSPSNLVENDIVDMSKTTFTCCQSILSYTESFLKIYTPALLETFVDCLSDLFRHIVNNILENAFEQETLLPKTDFLMKNSDLLIKSALPAIALKIQKTINQQIPEFTKLQEELVSHIDLVERGWTEGRGGDSENSDEDRV